MFDLVYNCISYITDLHVTGSLAEIIINIFDAIDLAILRRQQSFSFQGKSYYFQYVGNTLREDLHAIEETNQDLSNLWYNQEMTKRNPIMSFCKTQWKQVEDEFFCCYEINGFFSWFLKMYANKN